MKKLLLLFVFLWAQICAPTLVRANDFDTDKWNEVLTEIQERAVAENISPVVINDVIQPSEFISAIVASDKNQAEFKLTLDEYLTRMVNPKRIADGQKMRRTYPTLLSRVNRVYGVPPHVILAFWGMESQYGEYKARYKLSDAFLTLIYDGRRKTFFEKQLFALMKHADENNLKIANLRGSWAGAMGHFQFIPTTLEQYGADGNGDGRIDIVNDIVDAMFSAGNYLGKLGWNRDERIVRRVTLPADFDMSLCDGKTKKTLPEWRAAGVIGVPNADMVAGIVCDTTTPSAGHSLSQDDTETPPAATPSPAKGNIAYLTYPNFYRIKRWNNSNRYAIAVAELADHLR